MLDRQLRQIGLGDAALIVLTAAGVTYAALNLSGVDGGDASPPARTAAARAPAATIVAAAPAGNAVPQSPPTTVPVPPAPVHDTRLEDRALRRAIGQRIVAAFSGITPNAKLLASARAGRIGGVILFGENIVSREQVRVLSHRLQLAAKRGGNPRLMIMTDQEGGTVRRLGFASPTVSAEEMGANANAGLYALQEGRDTAEGLRQVGVNVDLAPVADVPTTKINFLGTRAFANDPGRVAIAACAFSKGLLAGGVLPTLKHFPGLGRAGRANTDDAPVRIDTPLRQLREDWVPYRKCGNAGLVMLSNATYSSLTGSTPAVMSQAAIAELHSTGFQGLTITDSLGAKALDAERPVAVRVARAGVDLQLYQSQAAASSAFTNLHRAARSNTLDQAEILAAAGRITGYKLQLQLTG